MLSSNQTGWNAEPLLIAQDEMYRNAAQDEMLSLEEMLQRMKLIIIKLKYSKHEKYIKWPSNHAFFILPHTTLLWAMWTWLLKLLKFKTLLVINFLFKGYIRWCGNVWFGWNHRIRQTRDSTR